MERHIFAQSHTTFLLFPPIFKINKNNKQNNTVLEDLWSAFELHVMTGKYILNQLFGPHYYHTQSLEVNWLMLFLITYQRKWYLCRLGYTHYVCLHINIFVACEMSCQSKVHADMTLHKFRISLKYTESLKMRLPRRV